MVTLSNKRDSDIGGNKYKTEYKTKENIFDVRALYTSLITLNVPEQIR